MITKVLEKKSKIPEDWFKTILLLVDPVRNSPPITRENLLTKMETPIRRNCSILTETKTDSLILLTMISLKMEKELSIIESIKLRD